MKSEHKEALLNGKHLESPTGRLYWYRSWGYFNCLDSDCLSCRDWELTWEELEAYYNQWEEDEWEID